RVVGQHPARTPVYLGDDTTDEDAFAVLQDLDREVVTVRVGQEDTCADYRLSGPEEVVTYLRRYVPS
ncbi:MAG: trehalose-phosphatase, partial [Bacteroidetes bacterium QH_1_61_8]